MQSLNSLARSWVPGWLSMFCPQTRLQGVILGLNMVIGAGCKVYIDRSLHGRVQEIESGDFTKEVEACETNKTTVHGKHLSQQMLWTAGAVLAVFAATLYATVLVSKNSYTSSDVYLTMGASFLPAIAKELYNFKNFKKSDAFAGLIEGKINIVLNGELNLSDYPYHLSYALSRKQVEDLAEKAEKKGLNTLELKNFPCDGYRLFGLRAFLDKFKTIDFTGFKGGIGGFVRDSLKLEQTETLNLSHIILSERYLKKIAKSFPNLKTLNITGCFQPKEGAFTVERLEEIGFENLETLAQNPKDFFMALMFECKEKKLKELNLTPYVDDLRKLSDRDILELAVFAGTKGISKFRFEVTDDPYFTPFGKGNHNGVCGERFSSLFSMHRMEPLEDLDLSGTFLSEGQLSLVNEMFPDLKTLNVRGAPQLQSLTLDRLKGAGFAKLETLIKDD